MHKRILENLNEAVLLFDRELKLTYINTAGEVLFADSARHLVGMSADVLFRTSDPAIANDLLQSLTLGEALVDRELSLELAEKSVVINFSSTPLYNGDVLSDILVELLSVDRHLRISQEEQLLAQQSTARMLVRGLAHEIKNPLGGLRGAAQLLESELSDPELKEYTEIIIAESDRLQGLMDKMLGPNTPPNKTLINIHEILERVRQLVQVEITGKVAILQDYDPSLPAIKADRNMIIQVILNIVRNAVQAVGSNGEIILKTRICRQMTLGRKRYKLAEKIDVIDNGPGIKPEMTGKIFYPMITSRAEGTGLGLSIAQSLVNQHDGIIECNSSPGKTIFSIYLPLENGHE
ncbi:MAG: nitrogen regulation protein NR(II) [Gammaproteobacteria bacterium]